MLAAANGLRSGKTNLSEQVRIDTQMQRFTEGDRVRIDIPNERDPDHDRFHGVHGRVVMKLKDDASGETGDPRDDTIFRIELDTGETADFRWRDVRPTNE